MLATPDQQTSLTDPDARSMATSGRGSGVVGYNVQVAVDTEHHLIVTHEVSNVGTDRSQLAHVAKETKVTLEATSLDVVADRGYFNSEEILACEEAHHGHAAKADDLELKGGSPYFVTPAGFSAGRQHPGSRCRFSGTCPKAQDRRNRG